MQIPHHDRRAVALTAAIQHGDVEQLQALLVADPLLARVRLIDGEGTGRTLLHVAADWPGHFPHGAEKIALLLAAGAEVNAGVTYRDPQRPRATALHWAASSDDVAVLDALLDGGADMEAPGAAFTGGSPMSDAVVFAQWNAARRLFARGARTTLWQAAGLGSLERVEALYVELAPGAAEVTNALWHACRAGHQHVAEWLVQHGADVHWVGHQHKTPLQVAEDGGHHALAHSLRGRIA